MTRMENTPTNPCVGCGPANKAGMGLAFTSTQDGATATWVTTPQWQGFPGRIHSAAFYLALIETMNWSLYARTQRMGLPSRTGALDLRRRVGVGDTIILTGRVLAHDATAGTARAEAVASTPSGEIIAKLDRDYEMVDEATFLARMGYDALPDGYDGAFD